MPGFDGTGPRGTGAMTGGGRGYCAIDLNGEVVGQGVGRLGMGRRMGRGRGNCFRVFRNAGQVEASRLNELQEKFDRLQAEFEALKGKGQQS